MNNNKTKFENERNLIRKNTGDIIRKNRIKHNISQESLANTLGVTKSSISRYEAGLMEIPASLLPIICKECMFSPLEYASIWMNMKLDEIPLENKELYVETLNLLEYIINESMILTTADTSNSIEMNNLSRIHEMYKKYIDQKTH